MTLVSLQRAIARAVMQPLTSSERMRRSAPDGSSMSAYTARFIKPNDRLTSLERLEIYNRQYWFRLLSSMVEDSGLARRGWQQAIRCHVHSVSKRISVAVVYLEKSWHRS